MLIKTIDDAKVYATNVTSGRLNLDEASERIESFRKFKNNATEESEKLNWQERINELISWINSEQFKNGDFPQGIDTLVLDLIEWRAMIYAFTHAKTKANPFDKSPFFSQWITGAAYAVFSIIGKLNSHNKDDNSLRCLWNTVKPFIEQEGVRSGEEICHIDNCLDREHGHFTKARSKAILFRHTVIAHNAKSLNLSWDEIDPDIQILTRIWGLIISWCSFGIIFPFRRSEHVFSGLEHYYDLEDMGALCAKRDEYIERAKGWCNTHLHNERIDTLSGPFATLSVSVGRAHGSTTEA